MMRIGELAKIAQCTVQTIRYYEKEGLLPVPERTEGNYRSYGQNHGIRLRFIRNCRTLGMAHSEIRALLDIMAQPTTDCAPVSHLLDEHIEHVDMRIQELLQLKNQLSALRQHCQTHSAVEACGIVHGLVTMETEAKLSRRGHLG